MDLVMDYEEVCHVLDTLMLLGSKGTTGTQASFLELFDGDHEKCKALDRKIAEKMGFKPASRSAAKPMPASWTPLCATAWG